MQVTLGEIIVGGLTHYPKIPWWDKAILVLLVFLGFFSIGSFSRYWFHSDYRGNLFLFSLLSFGVFWGIFRSAVDWFLNLFAKTPSIKTQPSNKNSDFDLAKIRVDVLTTAMPGEPFAMFEKTLKAIAAITTPHDTYLLDGGNDPALIELCRQTKTIHINCKEINGAKAGKINHCLQNFAKNPYLLILDPDHIPKPDFLEIALPPIFPANVGFVQVVQAYYNKSESFVAWAAAEQTFGFYGPTLISLNGVGIPTAIGANCLFKREAIDSIGGHAVHLAEDALTSMRIHAEGWTSVYIPFRGSYGLSPADLGAYFKQQLKWSTGMFLLLFKEYPKLFKKFGLAPRLQYLSSGSFYFGGLASALTLFLPILFLFGRIHAIEMPLSGFLAHILPYVGSSVLIHIWISRWYTHSEERVIPWRSMVLDKATWHIYLLGLFNVLIGRKVPYLPTPKVKNSLARPDLVWPHLLIIIASILSIAFAFLTYPVMDDGSILMIGFAIVNCLLLLPISALGMGWVKDLPTPRTSL